MPAYDTATSVLTVCHDVGSSAPACNIPGSRRSVPVIRIRRKFSCNLAPWAAHRLPLRDNRRLPDNRCWSPGRGRLCVPSGDVGHDARIWIDRCSSSASNPDAAPSAANASADAVNVTHHQLPPINQA